MIDWFIVIVPFVLVPVLLLLVFVGCTLGRGGTKPFVRPAELRIGPGSFPDVDHITVTFSAEGDGPPFTSPTLELAQGEIVEGASVEHSEIDSGREADVTCTCTIIVLQPSFKAIVQTAQVESEEWVLEGFFVLSGQEHDFKLGFTPDPQLVLNGGL